ncbi:DeoR family transcriptional regulator [Lacticaseibacillus absianus]|uniref:DeoR family transcriptional regulator n=1 Tax=Lacticaseibacillus absianus TaxID=2729623 RepID=UPI0015CCF9FE|nr:DeoR family transcriptional regulator [Lacticaseibacillus absianus]
MRTTESAVIARRNRELAFLKQQVHTTTSALAAQFDVSLMTINRDLHMFIKKGLVLHDYGEVVWVGDLGASSQISDARAQELIPRLRTAAGDAHRVLMSTSPLTAALAYTLAGQGIHFMTNQLVQPPSGVDPFDQLPVLTGGQLERFDGQQSFSGDTAIQAIKHFDADLALIYAVGYSARLLTTSTLYESVVARTMLESAHQVIVFLADGARGHEANFMIVKSERLARVQVI